MDYKQMFLDAMSTNDIEIIERTVHDLKGYCNHTFCCDCKLNDPTRRVGCLISDLCDVYNHILERMVCK